MKEPNEEYIKPDYKMHEKYHCTGKCKEFKDMTIPEINQEMNKGVFLTRWELLLAAVGIAVLAREEIRKAIFDAGVYGNAILAVALIFFLARNKK
jgi:hypothetical protein